MKRTSISADACAKCILFGEHSVVYGEPALALPLKKFRLTARLLPSSKELVLGPMPSPEAGARVLRLLQVLSEELRCDLPSGALHIDSAIPGSGLGSSAALAVALARLLVCASGREVARASEEVNRAAYEGERLFHGRPSGVDNTVVSSEHPVWFQKDSPLEHAKVAAGAELVVLRTGLPSPTVELVEAVARRLQERPPLQQEISRLGAIARRGRGALARGDWRELGVLMSQAQGALTQLGVSSPVLEALCQSACEGGALGAKLTGAGGGGNALALARAGMGQRLAEHVARQHPDLPVPLVCPL